MYTVYCAADSKAVSNVGLAHHSALKVLLLSNNSLRGAPPRSLGSLTQLTSLGLSWNDLSGAVPYSFANLTKLSRMSLQSNPRLKDPFPRKTACSLSGSHWGNLEGKRLEEFLGLLLKAKKRSETAAAKVTPKKRSATAAAKFTPKEERK